MAWEAKFSWRKITRVLNVKILEVQRSRSNTIIFFKGHARRVSCREEAKKNKKTNKQTKTKKISQTYITYYLDRHLRVLCYFNSHQS